MADYEVDVFIADATATVTSLVSGSYSFDVELTDVSAVNNITEVSVVVIDLPVSLQAQKGDPGDTMVFVQEANPATQYGWGLADAGKVWIPATGL